MGRAGVRSTVVPSPNSPWSLTPQAQTWPSAEIAYPFHNEAATAVMFDRVGICTGRIRATVVPSPIWPWPFHPQAHTVPSTRRAYVVNSPVAMPTTPFNPGM